MDYLNSPKLFCSSSFQTSANRKQVENMAKKKLDNLMKESKIRDREDPDSFTIAALTPAGNPADKTGSKVHIDRSSKIYLVKKESRPPPTKSQVLLCTWRGENPTTYY